MSRKSKKAIIYGSISCLLAIGFALLYYFNIIKTLDSFLSLTYVAYFISLALIGFPTQVKLFNTATKVTWGFPGGSAVRNPPAMQESWEIQV